MDEVLVVGAGPVGLTVGIELFRRGVPCRVIDRLVEAPQYAKAVGIQPRTLEVWENLGVLRDALDAAVPLHGQLFYINGKRVARMDLAVPPDVPYRFVALPQHVTERLLTDRLYQLGGHIERGVELVGFESDSDGVNAAPHPSRPRSSVARTSPGAHVALVVGCSGSATGCPIGTVRGVFSLLATPLISTRRPVLRA
ncbi:MAG: FAD-dependent monooxygenase [Pseudonocardiaceae bacterium]